jgi:transcriptional regulator with XRE-family HTH domain
MIEKLNKYIEAKDIKKKKVAKDLGITNVYLSYILNGFAKPSIMLENRIKEYLE